MNTLHHEVRMRQLDEWTADDRKEAALALAGRADDWEKEAKRVEEMGGKAEAEGLRKRALHIKTKLMPLFTGQQELELTPLEEEIQAVESRTRTMTPEQEAAQKELDRVKGDGKKRGRPKKPVEPKRSSEEQEQLETTQIGLARHGFGLPIDVIVSWTAESRAEADEWIRLADIAKGQGKKLLGSDVPPLPLFIGVAHDEEQRRIAKGQEAVVEHEERENGKAAKRAGWNRAHRKKGKPK